MGVEKGEHDYWDFTSYLFGVRNAGRVLFFLRVLRASGEYITAAVECGEPVKWFLISGDFKMNYYWRF